MNWKKRHQNQPQDVPAEPPADAGASERAAGDPPSENAWTPDAGPAGDEALEHLRAELDAANDKYIRALADYQNFQRRARLNEEEARRQAIAGVLMSIVPVLDHFDIALEQTGKSGSAGVGAAEPVLEGMRAIRAELVKALAGHGVSIISPAAGEEFDPHRHQAVTQQPAGGTGVQPGHVLATFQAGYALGDRVIRPAKVAVAAGD